MAPTAYFAVGAALMWIGTLAFGYLLAGVESDRGYYLIVAAVAATAALCYTAMAAGLGIVSVGGQSIYLPRYVQWIVGTPLIVAYLGLLAGVGRLRLWALVGLDVVAMLATPAAAVLDPPAQWAAFGAGTVLFVVLVYALLSMLGTAAAERPAPVRSLFRKLRNLTVVVWSFYPVVWLAGPFGFGVVDPASEVLLVTYMDLIAKVAFGFIAFNSRRAIERLPDLDALQGLATGG